MPISNTIRSISLAAGLAFCGSAQAATVETDTVDGWLVNAYTSDKTGTFQTCSMKSPGNDQVYLTVSANSHNRWFLWLYRSKWDVAPETNFIATLNLDQDRRDPIALEAKVSNDRFISLRLPASPRVLDLLSHATKARVSRESHAYTFSLLGYDKAVAWVKSCLVRNNALEAMKPDARIKGADDDDNDAAGVEIRKARPSEAPKATPKLPADVIEVKTQEPSAPATPPAPQVAAEAAKPVAPVNPLPSSVVQTISAVAANLMSDAARATSSPIAPEAPQAPVVVAAATPASETPAQILLPRLIAAANRSDFATLDKSAAPAALQRADVVFRLTDVTGGVIATDLPTAEAAANEILAYDRIACGGIYTATSSETEDGGGDVLRASSQCKTGDTALNAHYLTLSRKAGGYFVIGLTSQASASGDTTASAHLAATDQALYDAALRLTGKF